MSNKDLLDNIKKLREMTGVGFKDCKLALDESKGNIEKSIEFLRKKGIAKASKKMSRTASEGLALVKEVSGQISIIEINSETDFVAKNQDFINFCKELSVLNFSSKGDVKKLNEAKMSNGIQVKDNLINLIRDSEYQLDNNIVLTYLDSNKEKIIIFFRKDNYDILGWRVIDKLQNVINFSIKINHVNSEINSKIFKIPPMN